LNAKNLYENDVSPRFEESKVNLIPKHQPNNLINLNNQSNSNNHSDNLYSKFSFGEIKIKEKKHNFEEINNLANQLQSKLLEKVNNN